MREQVVFYFCVIFMRVCDLILDLLELSMDPLVSTEKVIWQLNPPKIIFSSLATPIFETDVAGDYAPPPYFLNPKFEMFPRSLLVWCVEAKKGILGARDSTSAFFNIPTPMMYFYNDQNELYLKTLGPHDA